MTSTITSFALDMWSKVGPAKHIDMPFDRLTNNELIEITDNIHDIFKNTEYLDPPALCSVGSQSSGKSSLFSALMRLKILPSCKNIGTRTPIHVRLIHKNVMKIVVEFFEPHDCQKLISTFFVDVQTTPNDQLEPITAEIIRLTNLYAGGKKNVVDTPINIRITSPSVPNLSIIDLPGLTNIALMDQGQPENIKENIENIIIKYIKNPRTIILAIIPAAIDVEADMGLGLIKRYDPNFDRTIGVFTKVDMLRDTNVENYLSEQLISSYLKVRYGYFAVRNRSSEEEKIMSVVEGIEQENRFFADTEPYRSSQYKHKMGTINLGAKLSEILLDHLRATLPVIMEEIAYKSGQIEEQLNEIGCDYPITEDAKRSTLNHLLPEFYGEYANAIQARGSFYNTGALISKSLDQLEININQLDPFSPQIFNDNLINTIVNNYHGIHMPDITVGVGIIEKCFQGIVVPDVDIREHKRPENDDIFQFRSNANARATKKFEPLKLIKEPYGKCMKEVQMILVELVNIILQNDKFSRFPKLCTRIREIVANQIIPMKYESTNKKVSDLFEEETKCIWTNDKKFKIEVRELLSTKAKDGSIDPKIIREVLTKYFNIVKNHFIHSIHKKIHAFFVDKVIVDINSKLIDLITTKADFNQLLEEEKETALKREKLMRLKEKIDITNALINGL